MTSAMAMHTLFLSALCLAPGAHGFTRNNPLPPQSSTFRRIQRSRLRGSNDPDSSYLTGFEPATESFVAVNEVFVASVESLRSRFESFENDNDATDANDNVKFHNRQRGYIRCTVTPETWTSDYMIVDQVLEPGGVTTKRASFVVEEGNPTIHSS